MRWVRTSLQLSLVVAAVALTVANSPGPVAEYETRVLSTAGDVAPEVDRRVYTDKDFEATFPGGDIARVILIRRPSAIERPGMTAAPEVPASPEEGSVRPADERVLVVGAGDPRLAGDPVYLELFPANQFHGRGSYVLTVEYGDGRVGTVEFTFDERY